MNEEQKPQKPEMSEMIRRLFAGEKASTLAAETGYSERTLQIRKKEIIDSGILTVSADVMEKELSRGRLRDENNARILEIISELVKQSAN